MVSVLSFCLNISVTNRKHWSTSVKTDQVMEVNNTAFVSPTANAPYSIVQTPAFVDRILESLNFWSVSLTLLLLAVTYDQCMLSQFVRVTPTYTWQALTNFKNMASLAQRGRLPSLGPSLTRCDQTSRNIKRNGQAASSAAYQCSTSMPS